MAKQPKPQKYPKKFRQKLEKMRSDREQRALDEAAEKQAEEEAARLFGTLYRSIIPKHSVEVMTCEISEEKHGPRFISEFTFKPRPPHRIVEVPSPWSTPIRRAA